eukprot:38253-Eustigmatos_ZCMA.PRE.1
MARSWGWRGELSHHTRQTFDKSLYIGTRSTCSQYSVHAAVSAIFSTIDIEMDAQVYMNAHMEGHNPPSKFAWSSSVNPGPPI